MNTGEGCLEGQGYRIARQVFQPDEIRECRAQVLQYFADPTNPFQCSNGGFIQQDALGFLPALRFLLNHRGLQDAIQSCCGSSARLLPHHEVQMNRTSSWHKDLCDMKQDPWQERGGRERWSLYKCIVYLQPESPASGGLSIRLKSHETRLLHSGPIVSLHLEPGDAVFFDQRLSHVGQPYGWLDKLLRRVCLGNGKTWAGINQHWRRLQKQPDRIALLFSVGKPNEFTYHAVQNVILRQQKANGGTEEDAVALQEFFELPVG